MSTLTTGIARDLVGSILEDGWNLLATGGQRPKIDQWRVLSVSQDYRSHEVTVTVGELDEDGDDVDETMRKFTVTLTPKAIP